MTSSDAPFAERQRAHLQNRIKVTKFVLRNPDLKPQKRESLEKKLEDYEALLKGVKALPEPLSSGPSLLCLVCNKVKPGVQEGVCSACREKLARRRNVRSGLRLPFLS
jgi:hypothetical protein